MQYSDAAWKRLGNAVQLARKKAGYRKMPKWSEAAGVSSRTLYALERGESVSDDTLTRIEDALDWPRDFALSVLTADAGIAAPVTGPLTVGDLIGALRRARGWTHFEMAAELQVSEAILREWERGDTPIDRYVLAAIERLLAAGRDDADFRGRALG